MNKNKKICYVALICVAIICLVLAAVMAIIYFLKDADNEQKLDEYRVETVTPVSTFTPAPTAVSPNDDAASPTIAPTESPANSGITAEPEDNTVTSETATPQPTEIPQPTAVPNPYEKSFVENSDMAGWLLIPGTNIDYPVMWTPADENYYLYRAFDKSEDVNGSLILDTDSSLNPLTTNLIIHGHNMKSGAMFGNLTDYESQKYYEEHKQIILYTEECQRNYEIIAVFRSQVYKKSDNVFKFYKFFQADTEAEFNDFYENIKELSMYDTGVTAEFGDHFITLSTCVYHVTNGRFVVVAKEVAPGETYLPIER